MNEEYGNIYRVLCDYISPARQKLFERILAQRTRYLCGAIEDIYQDHNAGAIMRSFDGFGIQNAHVIQNYNTLKISESVSLSAQKWLSISYYKKSSECVSALRRAGYAIVASSPHHKALMLDDFTLAQPTAIFFGGEKEGLSDDVMAAADGFIALPNVGFSESYNVSVAAALILYHLTQRLHLSGNSCGLSEKEKERLRVEWAVKSIRGGKNILERLFGEESIQKILASMRLN